MFEKLFARKKLNIRRYDIPLWIHIIIANDQAHQRLWSAAEKPSGETAYQPFAQNPS